MYDFLYKYKLAFPSYPFGKPLPTSHERVRERERRRKKRRRRERLRFGYQTEVSNHYLL